jgi:two-component system sensor histidine kinase BaeS
MRSLTFKMVLAFLGIAFVSIALIVLLARWRTNTEFSRFVVDRKESDLVEKLETYYRAKGSWDGISKYFAIDNNSSNPENAPPRAPYFIVADENGQTVSPGLGYGIGQQVQHNKLERGIPIDVDGERVGTLIVGQIPPEKNPREKEFLQRTNLMLVYSALGASLVALLIGIFLSQTFTRPIRELTSATYAIAEGELGAQVSVRSKDEMGKLTTSFNKMSADLARSTEARKQMTADIAHELRTP